MTAASAPAPAVFPVVGIIGKLPAHGDFVRRGGPGAVLTLIDHWLDTELGGAVSAGMALDDAVTALDGRRFAFTTADGQAIAVAIASGDAVGRVFPLIATTTGIAADIVAADDWCAAVADALSTVRDAGQGADAALSAVAAVAPPAMAAAPVREDVLLPVGDAFRALLSRREP